MKLNIMNIAWSILVLQSSVIFSVHFNLNNYQNSMLQYVKNILPEDPIILEAGGRFGEDSINMMKIWPKATMHIFEPLPTSFEILKKNTNGFSKAFCYPYALATYEGTTQFYVNPNNPGASSIGYPVEWNKHEFVLDPMEVSCITLNEWVKRNQIDRIDFMWLDMEGYELYALQHGTDILHTVRAIYTEISFVPVREGSCGYQDLKNFLIEEGFQEVWKTPEGGRYGDALFIRKDYISLK